MFGSWIGNEGKAFPWVQDTGEDRAWRLRNNLAGAETQRSLPLEADNLRLL
jgi:hypothetical protein